MKILVTKRLGNTDFTFEVENSEVKLAFKEVAELDRQVSSSCGFCNSTNLRLFANEDEQGNIYVKLVCMACKAYKKLGENKVGGGWFFRTWVKYNPETRQEEKLVRTTAPAQKEDSEPSKEADDLPF